VLKNPSSDHDHEKAANGIAELAGESVGSIVRFQWDIAVTRIGQLATEMIVPTQGLSVGGSNGHPATKGDACQKQECRRTD